MVPKSYIWLASLCILWLMDSTAGHDCSRLLSTLDERANSTSDAQEYKIKIGHPFLDVSKGYVSNVQYSMTVTSPPSTVVQEVVLMSLSLRRTKRESIGAFHYDRQHFDFVKCKPPDKEVGEIEMLVASSTGSSGLPFPMTVRWTAPRDNSPDCAMFKIAFASSKTANHWAVLKERMCKNRGIYHFITGHHGMEEFSWQGPTSRVLIVEAAKSSSVYTQIIRGSYSGPAGKGTCTGAKVRVSTDAIERNFTAYSRRLCFADAVSSPTNVFRSAYGIVILEVVLEGAGHFGFELSYYNLPADKGCNVTVIHRKSGTIQSPNYPSEYYGGMDCYYTIQVEKEERIIGRFIELQLSQPADSTHRALATCGHGDDFIHISSGRQFAKWCGGKSADRQLLNESAYEFQSADNILVVHFHSAPRHSSQTRTHQKHLFKIVWRSAASCPPSQRFTGMRGRITSVGYPKPYLNSQTCLYNIEVPHGFVVQLRFRDFRLQPTDRFVANCQNPPYPHDYVKVGERKFCGNWTGREAEGLVFRSATNFMSFSFVSDDQTAFNGGFSAEFRAVTPNETHECRPGQSFFGGLCYDVRDHPMDWTTALRSCQHGGGILAVVHSASVQRFLNRLLTSIDGSEDHGYWIGANDLQYESDFTWITGERIDYSNWFQGWPAFHHYNKQPNDDGLSRQDCLELRRRFAHPSKGHGYTDEFFWNDRQCEARNGFICQYARIGATPPPLPSDQVQYTNCNETITLTTSAWRASVSSPKYPQLYPNFADCYVTIEAAAPGHILIIEFNKFVLEDHRDCEYDYLDIWEEAVANGTAHPISRPTKLCGDKSEELKLLRRTVSNRRIGLHFVSDHSRVYMGYHLTVYMDDLKLSRTLNLCNDKNWIHFEDHCYLLVYYPLVDWKTAKGICRSTGHLLALPESSDEETFLVQEILKSAEYKIGDSLWLGARRSALVDSWRLENGDRRFNYTDWYPKEASFEDIFHHWQMSAKDVCLAVQQQFHLGSGSSAPVTARRPYWGQRVCDELGGYICKAPKPLIAEGQKLNDTLFVNGSGTLTLPSYPSLYPNFFDYTARLTADENTRILITFQWVDIEYQRNCSYDYLHLKTFEDDSPMNICGSIHDRKPNFASYANQAILRFHSDSSGNGKGFLATWQVINISDCYVDTEQPSGYINSVNFPHFYLNALDCTSTIRVPLGSRILLDFVYFDVGTRSENEIFHSTCHDTDYVSVYLDGEYTSRYVRLCGQLNLANAIQGLVFVSYSDVVRVVFHSDPVLWGVGYRAKHDMINGSILKQAIYPNETVQTVLSPNYPLAYPSDLCLQQVYRVRYGYQMVIEFQELEMEYYRLEGDVLFIRDAYQAGYSSKVQNVSLITYWNKFTLDVCSNKTSSIDDSSRNKRYKAVLTVMEDALFWRNKSVSNYTGLIETCNPSPCRNGGTCELGSDGYYCRCKLSYLGAFCHVSPCDLHPCVYGTCIVTSTPDKFRCDCQPGYEGTLCDEEIHRCASNPCQHGTCVEGLDSYTCICMDGYKGDNCQKADLLNATTLRESFLRDPFWLGLFLVLGVISLVGITRCFRKRFKYNGFTRVQDEEEALRRKETAEVESAEEQAAALLSSCLSTGSGLDIGECRGEGEDGEVYFTLRDLGIGPSHYRNLGHFEKVSFKLKLADLSEQELDVLEAYLEHIAATMEGTGTSEDEQRNAKGVASPILQAAPFATAVESVTGIILKSAEIVDEHQIQEELQHRRAMRLASSQSAAAIARRATSASVKQVQVIRGAARKAIQMVRRPRSIELAEIKGRASVKSLPGTSFSLGQISSSLATDTTYN